MNLHGKNIETVNVITALSSLLLFGTATCASVDCLLTQNGDGTGSAIILLLLILGFIQWSRIKC